MVTADQTKLKAHLTEIVTQLCRNVLQFESEITVEGLIGITLDHKDIFLVNINKTLTQHVDTTGLSDTHHSANSECQTLTSGRQEYFAHASGNVANALKRKRCTDRPAGSVHETTVRTHPTSLHTAKWKRRSSKSFPILSVAHTGSKSDNGPEAGVSSQSLAETGTASGEIVNCPHYESQCDVKWKDTTESIALVDCDISADNALLPSEQDDDSNVNRYSSAECWQSNAAAADDDGDNDRDENRLSTASGHQHVSDPSEHSAADEGSQLIISNVFTLKEEPVSDSESKQSSSFQCGFTSDSVPVLPPESQLCQTLGQITAVDQSSPLQISVYPRRCTYNLQDGGQCTYTAPSRKAYSRHLINYHNVCLRRRRVPGGSSQEYVVLLSPGEASRLQRMLSCRQAGRQDQRAALRRTFAAEMQAGLDASTSQFTASTCPSTVDLSRQLPCVISVGPPQSTSRVPLITFPVGIFTVDGRADK